MSSHQKITLLIIIGGGLLWLARRFFEWAARRDAELADATQDTSPEYQQQEAQRHVAARLPACLRSPLPVYRNTEGAAKAGERQP